VFTAAMLWLEHDKQRREVHAERGVVKIDGENTQNLIIENIF